MLFLPSENNYGIPGVPEDLDCTLFPDPTPVAFVPTDDSQELTFEKVNEIALDQFSENEIEKNEG